MLPGKMIFLAYHMNFRNMQPGKWKIWGKAYFRLCSRSNPILQISFNFNIHKNTQIADM